MQNPQEPQATGKYEKASPEFSTGKFVARRRSKHHRHRHYGGGHRYENPDKARRRTAKKAMLYITPSLLLVFGFVLWILSSSNPDPAMRPKDLIELSYWMMGLGGVCLFLFLLIDWARSLMKALEAHHEAVASSRVLRERMDGDPEDGDGSTVRRRRSKHRRHRHSHHSDED